MSILLPLISSKKLINQSNFLINSNQSFTFNQSNFSIISKISFNHMKFLNLIKVTSQLKFKSLWTHDYYVM